MKPSLPAHSQAKHGADSATRVAILLSTIIYIWLIVPSYFLLAVARRLGMERAYLLRHRGLERPREKTQGAVNPAKSDGWDVRRSCREPLWTAACSDADRDNESKQDEVK